MRRTFLALLVASALLGCTREEKELPTDWKSLALPGKVLTLIDEKSLEVYRFSEDGTAIATIGAKDGPVAGPILHWRIQENVLVISVLPDSEVLRELSSPSISGKVVTVKQESGAQAKYKLS